MILHIAAIVLIGIMFIWHFRVGGRANTLRLLEHQRDEGLNNLTYDGHAAVYIGIIGFLVLSAIILMIPPSPIWLEGAVGVFFVLLGFITFWFQKTNRSGGYFGTAIGVLILAGLKL